MSLSCSIPSCAIYYSVFESLRKQFYAQCTNHPMYILIDINSLYSLIHFVPAIISSISQVCTCLITSPIDRFRTQYWAKYEMIGFVDYVVVIKKLVNY